ncbi:hypothetical protein Hdeb2414_s0178g00824641 [Helianthus debilis subsp. tardiflorus]
MQFFHIMISDGGIDLAFCLCYATKVSFLLFQYMIYFLLGCSEIALIMFLVHFYILMITYITKLWRSSLWKSVWVGKGLKGSTGE